MRWSKIYHPGIFSFLMTCHLVAGVLFAIAGLNYGMTLEFEGFLPFYFIFCLLVVGVVMSTSTQDNSATILGFGLVIAIVTGVFLPMLVRRDILSFEELRSCFLLVGIAFAAIGTSGTFIPKAYATIRDSFVVSTILIVGAIVIPEYPDVSIWMRAIAVLAGYYVACALHLHAELRPKTLNRALSVGPKGYLVFLRGIALASRKLGLIRPMAVDDN